MNKAILGVTNNFPESWICDVTNLSNSNMPNMNKELDWTHLQSVNHRDFGRLCPRSRSEGEYNFDDEDYNEEENKHENHVIDDDEEKEDLNLKKSMRRAPTPETEVKMIARTFFVPSVITSSSCWENGC